MGKTSNSVNGKKQDLAEKSRKDIKINNTAAKRDKGETEVDMPGSSQQ